MSPTSYAELEIGLHRWNVEAYTAELRFSGSAQFDTESGASDVMHVDTFRGVRIDRTELQKIGQDPNQYGRALTSALFANPDLLASFAISCTRAQDHEVPLRLRLVVGPSAPELHTLRWETLQDPRSDDDRWLVTSEQVLFSRYLSSAGYASGDTRKRIRLRPRSELTALVAIAAPKEFVDGDELAPIDVARERERAEIGLAGIPITYLAGPERVTLNNLISHVRRGCDVLYLTCHGAMVNGDARLWLENEQGEAALTNAEDLVNSLHDVSQLPRLIVLASCQSAGSASNRSSDDGGELLRALGPRLAEAGIPAVLAMQGDFSMESAKTFLPTFFVELLQDGQIDRAMAVARSALRGRPDSWMPVLFMRLKSGRLWYTPGFATEDFRKWPAISMLIEDEQATPILGPGLTDALLGTHREIAQRWSEEWGFPLAPEDRNDLPQVAQYMKIHLMEEFPTRELLRHLREEVLDRYAEGLPPELQNASQADLHSAVFKRYRESNPAEPHKVLARLPFKLFITTNLGNAMTDALRDEGKDPQIEICRWNEATDYLPSVFEENPSYRPDVSRPLVYHAFGHLEHRDSIVLTEDDHFDYLIGVTLRRESIPPVVRRALVDTGLLFLGFQMDDWAFRVLFRSILAHEGGARRSRLAHVAVQVEPEEDIVLSPKLAKEYVRESFSRGASIDVFWGSVEDFATDLLKQYQRIRT